MPTYKVVLNGVLPGLDPCQVAPRLAVICKIPVEGAMALLANPSMVIKGALDQQTAAMYQAALRNVGCKARIEEEADARQSAPSPTSLPVREHVRAALNGLNLRLHADALARRVKSAVLGVAGLVQQHTIRDGGRPGWQEALLAVSNKFAAGARTLAAPSGAKRTLRAHPLIVASFFATTVAVAVLFASSGSTTEVPCPPGTEASGPMNCVGELSFPNGEKYVGEVKNGQPDGQGTYSWSNGAKYVGQWANGLRNGRGAYTWPNGERYVGEFQNNKKHGQGTLIYANGRKYVGEFKDGNPVGDTSPKPAQQAQNQSESR